MNPNDDAQIEAVYRRMYQAMRQADVAALDKLLTDDFHLVHMTGYDQPKAEWLAHIAGGKMQYFSSEEESITVRLQGNRATLTGRNRVRANIWGAQGSWPLQQIIQLEKQNDEWKISASRASMY